MSEGISYRYGAYTKDDVTNSWTKKVNCNNYRKVVHGSLWYKNKVLLSQRLKPGFHCGFWSDAGGKMENNELPLDALVREIYEETDLDLDWSGFDFIDCFIYPERKIKTFLFRFDLCEDMIDDIKNTEPHKQSNWQFFTREEALKLKLMPSVRFYLESL